MNELLIFQCKIPHFDDQEIVKSLRKIEEEFVKKILKKKNRSKTEKKRKKTTPQFDL